MSNFNLSSTIVTVCVVLGAVLGFSAFLILVERKIAAYVQDRFGPNRVGPGGLLQPLADGLKFLLKEDIIPRRADKLLYLLAPALAVTTALLAIAVVPFGGTLPPPQRPRTTPAPPELARYQQSVQQYSGAVATVLAAPSVGRLVLVTQLPERPTPPPALAKFFADRDRYVQQSRAYRNSYQFVLAPNVDIGIVFVFAVGSLAVYGVILGGWASNNKYSLLGALRSSAQIVSYEIPLGLSIVGVVLMTGSLNLERIIQQQTHSGIWNFFVQPLACLIFISSAFAECNRLPFDLPEAEQELIGGYHTEYSALKFAMFFLAEYTHMITTSFLMVIVFFGGWHFPWIAEENARWFWKLGVMGAKMGLFILFYMIVRWTIPRFRFDQLMSLAWKVMIPLALANVICVMVVKELGWSLWLLLPISLALLIASALLTASPVGGKPRRAVTGSAREYAVTR
jgi:NADH-quinone oxidoreductase subunit H